MKGVTMETKHIKRLVTVPQIELQETQAVSQKGKKKWKKTLGKEWVWFASIIIGSWVLSNILSFWALPGDLVSLGKFAPLSIYLLILIYGIRLTVWSIHQMKDE
jgi:hypothetical protein